MIKTQIHEVERLECFNGLNYKRWSMKIFFQLTVAKVAYVLSVAYPQTNVSPTTDGIYATDGTSTSEGALTET
mgnify:CR=1 FL=1